MTLKKKICVVVASRANYGRVKYLLKELKKSKNIDLNIIASASLLLFRYGKAVDILEKDGFKIYKKINYVVDGDDLTAQAKSTGLGIIELSTAFESLKPDAVVTVADRYETLATAVSASYLNIPLIHIQGGEISGNIDERVRHAITKLSDYHFPATQQSKNRLIRMGEHKSVIYNYGCPSLDIIKNINLNKSNLKNIIFNGTGNIINFLEPYILVLQHPVTTSFGNSFNQINETLNAVKSFKNYQKLVLWPNIDAGNDSLSKAIRLFREKNVGENFSYARNFSPDDYALILAHASCAVGNSSSFIREGAFLGVPSVIVGDRQRGREHGGNLLFAKYNSKDIFNKIKFQIKNKKNIRRSYIFGNGTSSKKIALKIEKLKLNNSKKLFVDG